MKTSASAKPWWQILYVQVLLAIVLGVLLGALKPQFGVALKPLADGFIALIKMLIAPIVFCTVCGGIAASGAMKKVGAVGIKALIYFEVMTTIALLLGLIVANVFTPGAALHANVAAVDASAIKDYTTAASAQSVSGFLLHVIPKTFFGAFAEGDLLQVLLLACLTGAALLAAPNLREKILPTIQSVGDLFFVIIGFIMKLAPIGAFAAMAYTVGNSGVASLLALLKLLMCVYLSCAAFVFIALALVLRLIGHRLLVLLRSIKEEIFLVLGTSSSESALPGLMQKLQARGCDPATVGLVVPAGYSFNLDGTCIYLTLAALFIAQAFGVDLSLREQLILIGVLLLTSKGAAGVTGAGFITLAATLSALKSRVPVEGVALILGIDRFMSEARAITNLVGNAVAAVVVDTWQRRTKEVD
jgi:aerobic C4-dicarboxylate transport protein